MVSFVLGWHFQLFFVTRDARLGRYSKGWNMRGPKFCPKHQVASWILLCVAWWTPVPLGLSSIAPLSPKHWRVLSAQRGQIWLEVTLSLLVSAWEYSPSSPPLQKMDPSASSLLVLFLLTVRVLQVSRKTKFVKCPFTAGYMALVMYWEGNIPLFSVIPTLWEINQEYL